MKERCRIGEYLEEHCHGLFRLNAQSVSEPHKIQTVTTVLNISPEQHRYIHSLGNAYCSLPSPIILINNVLSGGSLWKR